MRRQPPALLASLACAAALAGCEGAPTDGGVADGMGDDAGAAVVDDLAQPAVEVDAARPPRDLEISDGSGAGGGLPDGWEPGRVVYYWGDFDAPGEYRVGVLDPAVGETAILDLVGLEGGNSIQGVALSPDGSSLGVAGISLDGEGALLGIYHSDGSGAPRVLARTDAPERGFQSLSFSSDGKYLAFRSNMGADGAYALWVALADGSQPPRQVSPFTRSDKLDVTAYRWARAVPTTTIVFAGDLYTDGAEGLWSVDVSRSRPAVRSIVSKAEVTVERSVSRVIDFDDAGRVYFLTDIEVADGHYRLYRANADGSGREHLAATALARSDGSEASIGAFGIAPDGTRLAFAADAPRATLLQVYVLDLAGGAPAQVSAVTEMVQPFGPSGPAPEQPIVWSADGTSLLFSADWRLAGRDGDDVFSAFLLPSMAPAGGVRLVRAPTSGKDVLALGFAGGRVLVRGDLERDGDGELYLVDQLGLADQDPFLLRVEAVTVGGDVVGWVLPR